MPRRNRRARGRDDWPPRRLEEVAEPTYDEIARDLVAAGKATPVILGPSRFPREGAQ